MLVLILECYHPELADQELRWYLLILLRFWVFQTPVLKLAHLQTQPPPPLNMRFFYHLRDFFIFISNHVSERPADYTFLACGQLTRHHSSCPADSSFLARGQHTRHLITRPADSSFLACGQLTRHHSTRPAHLTSRHAVIKLDNIACGHKTQYHNTRS